MTNKENKKADYQFVRVPTSLLFALDPYCLKAMTLFIDKESYWRSRSNVFKGYFTLSVDELAGHLNLQNKKDARLTLEALYRAGLIDVKAESGKRLGARIKLNWENITGEDYDRVEKLPRGSQITYCVPREDTTGGTTDGTICTPTLEIDKEKETEKEKDINIEIEEDIEYEIDKYDDIEANYVMDLSTLKEQEKEYEDRQRRISNTDISSKILEDDNGFTINDLSNYYDDSFRVIRELERRNRERAGGT